MPGKISDFLNQFTADLARPSRFMVSIRPPSDFGTGIGTVGLSWRCEVANLPGRNISTIEQKTYGPFEKFAYHTSYSDIDLTFIMDGDMGLKYFFDAWINSINPTNDFNIEYKDNYVADINITQYDMGNNETYSVKLIDAYPININQLDLDWSNDGYHKLTVTFAYTYWINDSQNDSSPVMGVGNNPADSQQDNLETQ